VISAELVKLKKASTFTKAIAKIDKQIKPETKSDVFDRIGKNMRKKKK
jgi:hypothetical protein